MGEKVYHSLRGDYNLRESYIFGLMMFWLKDLRRAITIGYLVN